MLEVKIGTKLIAVGTRGANNLTYGNTYEVLEYLPAFWPSESYQAPACVTILGDSGKPNTWHLSRFKLSETEDHLGGYNNA